VRCYRRYSCLRVAVIRSVGSARQIVVAVDGQSPRSRSRQAGPLRAARARSSICLPCLHLHARYAVAGRGRGARGREVQPEVYSRPPVICIMIEPSAAIGGQIPLRCQMVWAFPPAVTRARKTARPPFCSFSQECMPASRARVFANESSRGARPSTNAPPCAPCPPSCCCLRQPHVAFAERARAFDVRP